MHRVTRYMRVLEIDDAGYRFAEAVCRPREHNDRDAASAACDFETVGGLVGGAGEVGALDGGVDVFFCGLGWGVKGGVGRGGGGGGE